MNSLYDAFISYGRADSKAFAIRLSERLATAGMRIWFDFNDIPLGVDFQQEINQGIQTSHNFIFIIAPHAVHSEYCRLEIEEALRHNKRIIPLLHVESISRDIWQQRYPEGTDRDWQAFQLQGFDRSLPNLHPMIRRINWVPFREGIDDFETAVQDLLALCQREQAYVHQHTRLLTQALAWQQQQKQPQWLLIGEERQQAELWLKRRFQGEQPPCLPTDLHCEFITESLKNANNLMTQVFLAYAEADVDFAMAVRRALLRQGITVWSSQQDIVTGSDFQQSINQGIEAADNLLYLLSPNSLRSRYCQQELDYALTLHKRIIPLQIETVLATQLPAELATLQYIDLSECTRDPALMQAQLQEQMGALLRILQQDEQYYNQHKVLLVKALKWERQHRNPTMLLRGSSLQQAESWLTLAQGRSQHQPTALQAEFITESLRLPPAPYLDIFISYSRTDSDFARRLNEALQVQGKTTWFDQESIPPSADFQQEIFRGIEQSNHFLFVLSPSAVNSPYCDTEVEYAQQLNKRVVTVLHRPIDPATLHPILAAIQWIDFSQGPRDFSSRLAQLTRTLDTDVGHLRAHTRLLVRAIEWQAQQHKDSLLLRGDDLEAAENWLTQGLEKQPRPTPLQVEYLQASRVADDAHQKALIATLTQAQQKANQRLRLGTAGAVLLVAFGGLLGWFAQQAIQEARRVAQAATLEVTEVQEELAQTRVRAVTQTRKLQRQIQTLEAANDDGSQDADEDDLEPSDTNVIVRTETIDAGTAAVLTPLRQDVSSLGGRNPAPPLPSSPADDAPMSVPTPPPTNEPTEVAPIIGTGSGARGSFIYDLMGQQLAALAEGSPRFSSDGKYIVTSSPTSNRSVSLLYNADGEKVAELSGLSPRFSPDGQRLVTTTASNSRLYHLPSQTVLDLQGRYPVFSPDGQRLVTYSAENVSYLYDLEGNLLRELAGRYPKFSADGQWLLANQGDRSYLYSLTTETLTELSGHSPSFSPNRQQVVVTAPGDRISYLYDLSGKQRLTFQGGYPSFSPAGDYLITHQNLPEGRTSYLYRRSGELLTSFPGTFRALSPDQRLLLATENQQSSLYTLQGEKLADYPGNFAIFSPDGRFVITAAENNLSYLYDVNRFSREAIAQLQGQNPTFSPRGQYVVTYSNAGQSYLYDLTDLTGEPLTEFPGQFPRFSPSGSRLATDQSL